jgi:hypothetical protein
MTYDKAALLAAAMVELDGKEPLWSASARGMIEAAIMFEARLAKRQRRTFPLRVRSANPRGNSDERRSGRTAAPAARRAA